jgi:hypothetical protein
LRAASEFREREGPRIRFTPLPEVTAIKRSSTMQPISNKQLEASAQRAYEDRGAVFSIKFHQLIPQFTRKRISVRPFALGVSLCGLTEKTRHGSALLISGGDFRVMLVVCF